MTKLRSCRLLALLVPALLAACVPSGRASSGTPVARCERYELPVDSQVPPGTIVHTGATLNPTAAASTEGALRTLHATIEQYRDERGRLPDSLASLLTLGPPDAALIEALRPQRWWLLDAWEQPIGYVRSGPDYTLRSTGPDQRPGTADDLVSRGPCTGTGDAIRLR